MTEHWLDELELVTNDGCSTWIRKDNFIDLQCIRESIIEDQYRLKSLVGKVDTVIDIGACQGVFAVRANTLLGCPVLSVEPHPDNFKILTLNSYEHGIIALQAAFSKSEKRSFLTSHNHEAANHLAETGVPVFGIDALRIVHKIPGYDHQRPALIKLDFEGGEDVAIREFLKYTTHTYIAGEWHHDPEPVRRALVDTGCTDIEVQGNKPDSTGLFFAKYRV